MSLREAAQQALEALEVWQDSLTNPSAIQGWRFSVVGEKAITALRAALSEDRPADTGKTSNHIADAGKMVATINEMETVEPVAWIGRLEGGIEYGIYYKAALKLPDGVRFDLYTVPPKREPLTERDDPPTSQESRQVEPVAYCTLEQLTYLKLTVPSDDKIPLYTAPPKREPLTEEEIGEIFISHGRDQETFARAIERAHGIGGEE